MAFFYPFSISPSNSASHCPVQSVPPSPVFFFFFFLMARLYASINGLCLPSKNSAPPPRSSSGCCLAWEAAPRPPGVPTGPLPGLSCLRCARLMTAMHRPLCRVGSGSTQTPSRVCPHTWQSRVPVGVRTMDCRKVHVRMCVSLGQGGVGEQPGLRSDLSER